MKSESRYALDNTSKKFNCPSCSKKRFVRYVDQKENKYLPEHVGRCDRRDSCGYHLPPREHFSSNPDMSYNFRERTRLTSVNSKPKPVDYIPFDYVRLSMKKYEKNNLLVYLFNELFTFQDMVQLVNVFKVGTSNMWNNSGATVFWQIDIKGRVRQAKIMLYDLHTGKRVKEGNKIYFYGKKILNRLGVPEPNLKQCFFGEHQLAVRPKKDLVCIVESEKTAIIMTAACPEYIWLATGGKNGCKWTSPEVFLVLTGRSIVLYPDLGAYEEWKDKNEILQSYGLNSKVSTLLELNPSSVELNEGYDVADYIIQDLKSSKAKQQGQTRTSKDKPRQERSNKP